MDTKEQAIAAAVADYNAALGTIIKPDTVTAYVGSNSVDFHTEGEVEVRVLATESTDLAHDTGGFIDPYWNVEIVSDPDNLIGDATSPWVFGPSHEYQR